MANIDLTKYGITGTKKLFTILPMRICTRQRRDPALTGFDEGQESELGAVNVMTGVLTQAVPLKDKFIVMDKNSKDTVWWTTPEYKNDNHPASEETWAAVKKIAL